MLNKDMIEKYLSGNEEAMEAICNHYRDNFYYWKCRNDVFEDFKQDLRGIRQD